MFLNFRIVINNIPRTFWTFFYNNPHLSLRGPQPRFYFARTELGLRTYSARTLHMFRHVLLMFWQIREICCTDVRENLSRPRSSSLTLVYHHQHLFSCDCFAPQKILSTLWKLCEFFLVNNPLPLTYFLSITSYCFTLDICLKWKSPVGTYRKFTKRRKLDDLLGRKFFLSTWKVQLLRVNFFEFAVSSGNLRLQMRWV